MRSPLAGLAVAFLWLQAIGVAAWWLLLWLWPAARPPFVLADWPETTLFAFALPDMAAIVSGSALAACGLRTQRAWGRPLLVALAGAIVYATLWCGGALLATGSGWLSLSMMLASSAGTLWALRATRAASGPTAQLASCLAANATSSGQNAAKSPSSPS